MTELDDARAPAGEMRRLTIMTCDLVGSTELSERVEPETYRQIVSPYRTQCADVIESRYGGHLVSVKGDGLLALFGYPVAHEDDAERAVRAAIDVCRSVRELSVQTMRTFGEALEVRAAVHRGPVYIDVEEDDVYGLAANVAARLESLADAGTVVVSEEIRRLVDASFELEPGRPQQVKGVADPVQPYTVVAERADPARRLGAPLVGRSTELAVLRSAWEATLDGRTERPTAVLLRGEGGIGKSRLAAALADEARGSQAVVLELAGSPFHADAGLHPVQALLEARCGIDRNDDSATRLHRLRRELEAASLGDEPSVSLLARVLGLPSSAGYEAPSAEGRKLNEAVVAAATSYLQACLGTGPSLLLLEDVQWFDPSTAELVAQVLATSPASVMVVLTSRGAAPVQVSSTLDLGPLTEAECHDLIESLDGSVEDAARAAVVARSDGIPLYVEELVRSGQHGVAGDPPGVPDVLYEPLVARLYSRSGGVMVAAAAATIGRTVDRALLASTVDVPSEDLAAELNALTGVLVPIGDGSQLRFRHELLREVAYELQPPTRLRQVHSRVADLLLADALEPDMVDWIVVAGHLERADRPGDAASALDRAADRARSRGALDEARTHLGRALDLVAQVSETAERDRLEIPLRLRRGFLTMSTEGAASAGAAADYDRCLELTMADARGDGMFSTLISLWAYHTSRAELGRARQVLETLRGALHGEREYFRAANRAGFGMIDWFQGDFASARAVLEEAVAELSADDHRAVEAVWFVPNDPTAAMFTHLALARFMCGDEAAADEAASAAADVVDALGFPQGPWSRAYLLWLSGWMRLERGDRDGASAAAGELLELSNRHGFDSWIMIALTQQAAIAASAAVEAAGPEAAAAASALDGMVTLWQGLGLLVFVPYYLTMIGAALAAAGDAQGARERLESACSLGERTGMRFYEAEALRHLAHLQPDEPHRRAGLVSALDVARRQGAQQWVRRIEDDLQQLAAPSSGSLD